MMKVNRKKGYYRYMTLGEFAELFSISGLLILALLTVSKSGLEDVNRRVASMHRRIAARRDAAGA